MRFLNFIDKHLFSLDQQNKTYTLDNSEVIRWIQEMSTLTVENSNPLSSDRWQRLLKVSDSGGSLKTSEDSEESWVRVYVEQRPRFPDTGNYRPFLIAQGDLGKRYFVGRNTLEVKAQM